jgi:hypothetical protein
MKAGGKPAFMLGLFFDPEDGGDMFLCKQVARCLHAGFLLNLFF